MKGKFTLVSALFAVLVVVAMCVAIPLAASAAPPAPGATGNYLPNVPDPDSFWQKLTGDPNFKVGGDYDLVNYDEIRQYFQAVAKSSPRVKYVVMGQTTGNKDTDPFDPNNNFGPQDMIMAVVSSQENIANLDKYLGYQKKLANPNLMAPGEKDKILADAKTVIFISGSVHSSEIAGSQMLNKLLYTLAAQQGGEVTDILNNVIVLLCPAVNPDGVTMETTWYRKYMAQGNTSLAGSGVPWLYQYYSGHDDNRDFFAFNLPETQNMAKVAYEQYFPEIYWDIHGMGTSGARLFMPPFYDPVNPNLHPMTLRDDYLVGGLMTTAEIRAGNHGVSTTAQYDTWYHGAGRSAPGWHNVLGILTEVASQPLANPMTTTWAQLTGSTRNLSSVRQLVNNYPDPWNGGRWGLPENVNYEYTAGMALLTSAARYRDTWVGDYYQMNTEMMEGKYGSIKNPDKDNSIDQVRADVPFAYIIPMDQQRDPVTTAEFLDSLLLNGMQIQQAKADFTADGKSYPAGTYIVVVNQPTRGNVLALFGQQDYPTRLNPDGTAEHPYDVAGWTYSYEMGVNSIPAKASFSFSANMVSDIPFPAGKVAGRAGDASFGYVFGPELNNAAVARYKLLAAGFQVKWVMAAANIGGQSFAPGASIVLAKSGLDGQVASLAKSLGVSFYPLAADPKVTTKDLSTPKIGLYDPWSGSMDQGWRRLILDQMGIPFVRMRNADVKAGNLNSKFDVIVLPDASRSSILNGSSGGDPNYTGGIGTDGLANLVAFVNNGGTLVAEGSSFDLARQDMGLAVKNVLSGVSSSLFYCPGSVLNANVDITDPVAFGMPAQALVYFNSNAAFNFTGADSPKSFVTYPTDPNAIMASGWVLGPEYLVGSAPGETAPVIAAAEQAYGSGKIVALPFSADWRAQMGGTTKFLLNSLFYATAK